MSILNIVVYVGHPGLANIPERIRHTL